MPPLPSTRVAIEQAISGSGTRPAPHSSASAQYSRMPRPEPPAPSATRSPSQPSAHISRQTARVEARLAVAQRPHALEVAGRHDRPGAVADHADALGAILDGLHVISSRPSAGRKGSNFSVP